MGTTKEYIRERLIDGINKNYSHMIVICDSWDYTDFIVYVKRNENLNEKLKTYVENKIYKIMEIYSYDLNLEYQLNEFRAYHESPELENKLFVR